MLLDVLMRHQLQTTELTEILMASVQSPLFVPYHLSPLGVAFVNACRVPLK